MIEINGTEVSVDYRKVKFWVQNHEQAGFCNVGISRNLTTAANDIITLGGGTYGNQIDVEAEAEQLAADLQAHENKIREPVYIYEEWGSRSENAGIGYDFIDIDLKAQTLYLVKDGRLVYTTPIVSGDPTTGRETPTGIYYNSKRITNPQKKHYNVDVLYWMQIDNSGDLVIHDAGWRELFGGTLYNGDGSKGNIEVSRDAAKYLYENTEVGIPVIVH